MGAFQRWLLGQATNVAERALAERDAVTRRLAQAEETMLAVVSLLDAVQLDGRTAKAIKENDRLVVEAALLLEAYYNRELVMRQIVKVDMHGSTTNGER